MLKNFSVKDTHLHPSTILTVESITTAQSPQDSSLFIGSMDNSAILLNSSSFESLSAFSGHVGAVTALCYSSTHNVYITASSDKSIQIWKDTKQIAVILGHNAQINRLLLTPEQDILFSASSDNTIGVCPLASLIHRFNSSEVQSPIFFTIQNYITTIAAPVRGISLLPDPSPDCHVIHLAACSNDGFVSYFR